MYVGMWDDGVKEGRKGQDGHGQRREYGYGCGYGGAGLGSGDIEHYTADPMMEVLDGTFMGGNFIQDFHAAEEEGTLGM